MSRRPTPRRLARLAGLLTAFVILLGTPLLKVTAAQASVSVGDIVYATNQFGSNTQIAKLSGGNRIGR